MLHQAQTETPCTSHNEVIHVHLYPLSGTPSERAGGRKLHLLNSSCEKAAAGASQVLLDGARPFPTNLHLHKCNRKRSKAPAAAAAVSEPHL